MYKAATKGSYSTIDVVLSVLLVIIVIAILSYLQDDDLNKFYT
ncbi:hypothetical protein OOZ15_09940 [Galbibacter sp. EGI 63066]|nr:hypothetical protein [Galbibacter sp. EGI 63066]MCX2680259.1 hypothetical protein [Galbibacter sp. EGI 63066]